jgi:hypothetical protein
VLPATLLADPGHLQLKGLAILLVHLVQPVTGKQYAQIQDLIQNVGVFISWVGSRS